MTVSFVYCWKHFRESSFADFSNRLKLIEPNALLLLDILSSSSLGFTGVLLAASNEVRMIKRATILYFLINLTRKDNAYN